ncbi:MAG: DNA ligase [Vibrio sp.]
MKRFTSKAITISLWSLFPCLISAPSSALNIATKTGEPDVALANEYRQSIEIQQYWFSEKYDGIRAIWNGHELLTRTGKKIHAPDWFTAGLPDAWIEGELWAGRGHFNVVQNTVLDIQPDEKAWRRIRWMVFDMPHTEGLYPQRYAQLANWVDAFQRPHVERVRHQPVQSHQQLVKALSHIDAQQGEGVMLQSIQDEYHPGRSDALLKMKRFADAEATVIGYKPGKGRWYGVVGSLKVRDAHGEVFYLGSGLTAQQRRHPPTIGSTVTFRFNGMTHTGKPRFARFLRVRRDD